MTALRFLDPESIAQFADGLIRFQYQHQIESLFTNRPVDHIAVKLADRADYERYLKEAWSSCLSLSYTPMPYENRDIATAILKEPIALVASDGTIIGSSNVLEIMEPRPRAVGKDIIGLEHIELVVESFRQIQAELVSKNVAVGDGVNNYHYTVVVRWPAADGVDGHWQEVKFTEQPLLAVIEQEKKDGLVVTLIPTPATN